MSAQEKPSIKKNTLYNALKTVSSIVFPLITFPYSSRVLGAESIGKVNFSSSIVSYFILLASLGITPYAVRECSKMRRDKEKLGPLAGEFISINLVTTAVAYALLAILMCAVVSLQKYRLLIWIQALAIILTTLGADWLNTAMEDFRYITLRTFAMQLLSLVLLFAFVRTPDDYVVYTAVTLVASSGANVLNIFYRRRFCRVRLTRKIDWKRHLPPILTMFAMLLSQSVLNNLDVTMLGFLADDRAVGLYSTAVKVTNIITQVVISITWVVMPRLSAGFARDDFTEINRLLHKTAVFTVAIGAPLLVGINMMAEETILLVGGKEYLEAASCLRVLSVNMACGFVSNIYGNMILLPANGEKFFLRACLVSALVNAATNMVAIPLWGINGASVTTAISGAVVAAMTILPADGRVRFGSVRSIALAPIVGCAAIAIICMLSRVLFANYLLRLLFAVVLSATAYASVLVIMKSEFAQSLMSPIISKLRSRNRE